MSCKVVLIGGGSYNWTPTLAADLFLNEDLDGGRLVLVDIDPQAARLLERYCKLLIRHIGCTWKVKVAGLDEALEGAHVVCPSISTGGLEAMAHDYHVPEPYGIFHTVGDTSGPGGISRTLRNVPVFVDFARRMEKRCPRAWMVHVTNPLSQLTAAVCRQSSIPCVGLCHNFAGTVSFLADYLGAEENDIDAASVGVNHFTFLMNMTCDGKPFEDRLSLRDYLRYEAAKQGPLKTRTTDDQIQAMTGGGKDLEYYVSFELFERFGYFPAGAAPHVVESLPHFCTSEQTLARHRVRRKGVLPGRQIGKDRNRQRLLDRLSGKDKLPKPARSRETFSNIVGALCAGRGCREIVSMPNTGQIPNLPRGAVVETWAVVNAGGVQPVLAGDMPAPLLGCMQTIIDEQELAIAAALTGDRRKVVAALAVSPMVANKDIVEELAGKLIAANRKLLPQFEGA